MIADRFMTVWVPIPGIDHLTYRIPSSWNDRIESGQRVIVPVKNNYYPGIIISIVTESPPYKCLDVKELLDDEPIFSPLYLELLSWLASYYNIAIGSVVQTLIPSEFFYQTDYQIKIVNSDMPLFDAQDQLSLKIWNYLLENGEILYSQLTKYLNAKPTLSLLRQWREKKLIDMHSLAVSRGKPKFEYSYSINPELDAQWNQETYSHRYPARFSLLQKIKLQHHLMGADLNPSQKRLITPMIRQNWVVRHAHNVQREVLKEIQFIATAEPVLTEEQTAVIGEIAPFIADSSFQSFLLFGVTGSGKTEVYLQLAKKVLDKGQSVLVLVPEIALTPRLTFQFRERLNLPVEVLHSRISSGERYDTWRRVMRRNPTVLIGARSAIFAPIYKPGLIIVDEEHEQTFKQSGKQPYYHARDVAVKMAQLYGIPIILGSATPSLESYNNARAGKYRYLQMTRRVSQAQLPTVQIFDLKSKSLVANIFSPSLIYMMNQTLNKGEQIILFLNRRGYAPQYLCPACGHVIRCPACDITLYYHQKTHALHCHYCEHSAVIPDQCPQCGNPGGLFKGIGLERVEETLHKLFPQAGIVRMDQDTTRGKDAHYKILKAFEEHRYDILIGTQMITKGLDFPRVTLVGVLSADTGLYLADFRAFERVFQLMTQVAGRAGRGDKIGRAIIQTYSPDNYCLLYAGTQNFPAFAEYELKLRQALNYPPYVHIVLVRFSYADEPVLKDFLVFWEEWLKRQENFSRPYVQLLGPIESPIYKLKNQFRLQMLIKTHTVRQLNHWFNRFKSDKQRHKNFRKIDITYDVDPQQMY